MVDTPAARLMTADELARLPDDGLQYELVRGKLISMPPSKTRAAVLAMELAFRLMTFVKQHRLGVVGGADWGFLLATNPDTVRAPDCAFVRAERIPAGGIPDGYFPGAPDLAVEVISPSQSVRDAQDKAQEYLEAGARLVWLLHPRRRVTWVYAPGRTPVQLGADGVLDGGDVLPGFTLPLNEVLV